MRIGRQIALFRQLLNDINYAFINVETGYRIAGELEAEGCNPNYDELDHIREFATVVQVKVRMLLEICEKEANSKCTT